MTHKQNQQITNQNKALQEIVTEITSKIAEIENQFDAKLASHKTQ